MPSMGPFHSLENRAIEYIREHDLISAGSHVLVAVSGGPDSVTLLSLLAGLQETLGIARITVVHFDHLLRGEESRADKDFVALLSEQFGFVFHFKCEDVRLHQKHHRVSLEMAARECRHRYFQESLKLMNAQVIALGHTSNDQAEEVLIRLVRGSGPSGLAAMLPKTGTGIIRPLLFATRREILSYLKERNLSYRNDSSNMEPSCWRNVLRLDILPRMERHFHPAVVETICRHARLAGDDQAYWVSEVHKAWPLVCLQEAPTRIHLVLENLLNLHPALQRRILRFAMAKIRTNLLGIYSVHVEAICLWLEKGASESALKLPGHLWVAKEAGVLAFTLRNPDSLKQTSFEPSYLTIAEAGEFSFSNFNLKLYFSDSAKWGCLRTKPGHFVLDAERLIWPLTVRSWRPGDRFRPLGMRGTKKLHDFFVDAKIPRSERSLVPLLCDAEKICCILGRRIDDRVKVTDQTKRFLIVESNRIES